MVLVSLLCPLFPRVSVDGGSDRPERPGVQARSGHGTNTSTAHPIHLPPSYRVIGACSAAFKAVGRTIHPHEILKSKKNKRGFEGKQFRCLALGIAPVRFDLDEVRVVVRFESAWGAPLRQFKPMLAARGRGETLHQGDVFVPLVASLARRPIGDHHRAWVISPMDAMGLRGTQFRDASTLRAGSHDRRSCDECCVGRTPRTRESRSRRAT